MTEPLLRRLSARGERLTVAALPWIAPVYRGMPGVTEVIEMPFKQVNQLIHYIDHEIAISQQQMPTNTVTVAQKVTTPFPKYGLKKDGTPKKRAGRPAKK